MPLALALTTALTSGIKFRITTISSYLAGRHLQVEIFILESYE